MTATGSLILFMPFGLNEHTCDCGLTNLCYYLLPLHFLLGAVVGVVRCVAGGDGGSLLGLFRMVGHVLVEVGQTQAVDIVGERSEATPKRQRDVRTAQVAVVDDIVNLQVRI